MVSDWRVGDGGWLVWCPTGEKEIEGDKVSDWRDGGWYGVRLERRRWRVVRCPTGEMEGGMVSDWRDGDGGW